VKWDAQTRRPAIPHEVLLFKIYGSPLGGWFEKIFAERFDRAAAHSQIFYRWERL
jgi:hypothetical protein